MKTVITVIGGGALIVLLISALMALLRRKRKRNLATAAQQGYNSESHRLCSAAIEEGRRATAQNACRSARTFDNLP